MTKYLLPGLLLLAVSCMTTEVRYRTNKAANKPFSKILLVAVGPSLLDPVFTEMEFHANRYARNTSTKFELERFKDSVGVNDPRISEAMKKHGSDAFLFIQPVDETVPTTKIFKEHEKLEYRRLDMRLFPAGAKIPVWRGETDVQGMIIQWPVKKVAKGLVSIFKEENLITTNQ